MDADKKYKFERGKSTVQFTWWKEKACVYNYRV